MSKIMGLNDLQHALDQLPDAMQRNVIRAGNRKIAEELRKGIQSSSWPASLRRVVSVDLADKRKSRMPRFIVGLKKPWSKLAHLFEFGTAPRVQSSTGRATGRMTSTPAMRQALEFIGGRAEQIFAAAASRNFALQVKKLAKK